MDGRATTSNRRAFMLGTASSAMSLGLGACSASAQPASTTVDSSAPTSSAGLPGKSTSEASDGRPAATGRVLLAYFSRAGENYFHGGRTVLTVGNTEIIARNIRDVVACDMFRIDALDPYPHSYDETVRRNVVEQEHEIRPAIVAPPSSIDAYDTVILGSPVWNVRAPRIMLTFVERYDFAGKTIHPFTTHAMSGLGRVVEEYAAACPGAKLGEALAVQGEAAPSSRTGVEVWLRRAALVGG